MTSIAYIANLRLPTEKAHGIQIMKMCEAFVARGAAVELIVPQRHTAIPKDPFVYYGVKRSFEVVKLPCLDLVRFGFFGFMIELFSFLIVAKWKIDCADRLIYSREWLASLFFQDVVLELHSLPERPHFLQRLALRRAARIITLTSYLQKELVRLGVFENKILIAPDAVEIQKFAIELSRAEARRCLGLDAARPLVVYTGHLYPWKGAHVLADAAAELPAEALVIFVGGTDKDIADFTKRFGKRPNIVIAGHKDPVEIPVWLKAADVLVLPNSGSEKISRFYTSPMKLFEYMAAGRPIVTADLPSIREILNEKSAVFFTADDPAALATAVKKVLENKSFADQLAARAFIDARAYTWDKRAEKILAVIQ